MDCKITQFRIITNKLSYNFLEGQTRVAVEQDDNAAIVVAVPFQALAHDDVGLVRIDADACNLAFAIVQNSVQDAVRTRCAGDAVDDVIGRVVEPLAVVNLVVSHFGAGQKRESADDGSRFVKHHMATA